MAIRPLIIFPGQIDGSDPTGYPHGKARNVAVQGDGIGTPWEERVTNDIFGFQQALLAQGGITPSGTPDKVGASQYLAAVREIIKDDVNAQHFNASGEVTLTPAVGYVKQLSFARGVPQVPSLWVMDGLERMRSQANLANWIWDITHFVPYGALLTRVDAILHPGAARTGTDRMKLAVRYATLGTASVPTYFAATYAEGFGTLATQPNEYQFLTLDMTSSPADVSEADQWRVTVTCGNDAGSNEDLVYGIQLYFATPIIQPI